MPLSSIMAACQCFVRRVNRRVICGRMIFALA